MNDNADRQRLAEYVRTDSQEAFCEIVRRHLAPVHPATVWRGVDRHLAADLARGAFAALARPEDPRKTAR